MQAATVGWRSSTARAHCSTSKQNQSDQLSPIRPIARAASTAATQAAVLSRFDRTSQQSGSLPRRNVVVQAGKAAPAGAVEEASAVAIGAYQGLPLFWQATVRLVGLAAVAIIGCNAIIRLLNWAGAESGEAANKVGTGTEEARERGIVLRLTETFLLAAHRPVNLLLPAATAILLLKEISRWLEVLVDLNDDSLPRFAGQLAAGAIDVLKQMDYWACAGSKVAVIVLGFWFIIAWKDRLIDWAIESRKTNEKMDRILRPFNTLMTWMLSAAGILNVLHVFGFNIQPLLAAGGVSGIAIGFGAQKLTQNVLSGASLFLTQPFVVGDRVQFLGSGGSEVVAGFVETISPMNTVVRKDDGVPVIIPNSATSEYLVANETRRNKTKTV